MQFCSLRSDFGNPGCPCADVNLHMCKINCSPFALQSQEAALYTDWECLMGDSWNVREIINEAMKVRRTFMASL